MATHDKDLFKYKHADAEDRTKRFEEKWNKRYKNQVFIYYFFRQVPLSSIQQQQQKKNGIWSFDRHEMFEVTGYEINEYLL